jgi:hypothetical protein
MAGTNAKGEALKGRNLSKRHSRRRTIAFQLHWTKRLHRAHGIFSIPSSPLPGRVARADLQMADEKWLAWNSSAQRVRVRLGFLNRPGMRQTQTAQNTSNASVRAARNLHGSAGPSRSIGPRHWAISDLIPSAAIRPAGPYAFCLCFTPGQGPGSFAVRRAEACLIGELAGAVPSCMSSAVAPSHVPTNCCIRAMSPPKFLSAPFSCGFGRAGHLGLFRAGSGSLECIFKDVCVTWPIASPGMTGESLAGPAAAQ